jgi:hypothetical protein
MSAWQPLRLGARVEHHGEEQWNTQTTSSKAKSAVECGETTRDPERSRQWVELGARG